MKCTPNSSFAPEPQATAPAGSKVTAAIRERFAEMRKTAGVMSSAAESELRILEDFTSAYTNLSASVPTIRAYSQVENALAAKLGWVRYLWQGTGSTTGAGAVRQVLRERSELAAELIRTLASYRALPRIKRLQREYLSRAGESVNEATALSLMYDQIVVGGYKKLKNISDSPLVEERVFQNYLKHQQNLQDAGFSDETVQLMEKLADEIHYTTDDLRRLAAESGISIETLQNGGYLPLQLTPEFERYLSKQKSSWLEGFSPLSESFQKARLSNLPVVANLEQVAELLQKQLLGKSLSDESLATLSAKEVDLLKVQAEEAERNANLAAYAILEKNPKAVDKAQAAYEQELAKVGGKAIEKAVELEKARLALLEAVSTPGGVSKLLAEVSDSTRKKLFESGLIQSLPAMSDELLEFYRGVDVGVRGLSDALILNPEKAIKRYSESLAKAASDQQLFKVAFDQGAEAGWVNTVGGKDYIRVGASPTLAKYLGSSSLAKEASELYIHKTAAEQLSALLELNTRPSNLASASSAWNSFFQPFKRTLLMAGGTGYVMRVFTQNLISTYAATGSIAQLPFAVVDTMRLLSKGFDGLPNTAKVFSVGGQKYSVPELFKAVVASRGGASLASLGESANLWEQALEVFDKSSRERLLHFNKLYRESFGDPLVSKAGLLKEEASEAFTAAYRAFAFSNQALDLAFRWATVRELATTKTYASLDDLLRETDTYFSINADAGSVGNWAGSFFMPFAQFAINSPGSALRHAIRHPWRAGNVMTMYASAYNSDPLSESELPEWLKENDSYFFTMYRDPETGKRGVVLPTGVDFMLDSYNWMQQLTRDLAGVTNTTERYVNRELDPLEPLWRNASGLLKKTYIADLAAVAFGLDATTLRPDEESNSRDTVLGLPTSKKVRTLLTSFFPLVRKLDESLPPSVVGQAPQTSLDPASGFRLTADAGTPGWAGQVPTRGGTKRTRDTAEATQWFTALTGVSVQEIDPQRNVISSYKALDTSLREIRKNRLAIYRRLVQAGAAATENERAYYNQLRDLEVVLQSNKLAIDNRAAATGQTPPLVFEQMQGKFDSLLVSPLQNDTLLESLQQYVQQDLP